MRRLSRSHSMQVKSSQPPHSGHSLQRKKKHEQTESYTEDILPPLPPKAAEVLGFVPSVYNKSSLDSKKSQSLPKPINRSNRHAVVIASAPTSPSHLSKNTQPKQRKSLFRVFKSRRGSAPQPIRLTVANGTFPVEPDISDIPKFNDSLAFVRNDDLGVIYENKTGTKNIEIVNDEGSISRSSTSLMDLTCISSYSSSVSPTDHHSHMKVMEPRKNSNTLSDKTQTLPCDRKPAAYNFSTPPVYHSVKSTPSQMNESVNLMSSTSRPLQNDSTCMQQMPVDGRKSMKGRPLPPTPKPNVHIHHKVKPNTSPSKSSHPSLYTSHQPVSSHQIIPSHIKNSSSISATNTGSIHSHSTNSQHPSHIVPEDPIKACNRQVCRSFGSSARDQYSEKPSTVQQLNSCHHNCTDFISENANHGIGTRQPGCDEQCIYPELKKKIIPPLECQLPPNEQEHKVLRGLPLKKKPPLPPKGKPRNLVAKYEKTDLIDEEGDYVYRPKGSSGNGDEEDKPQVLANDDDDDDDDDYIDMQGASSTESDEYVLMKILPPVDRDYVNIQQELKNFPRRPSLSRQISACSTDSSDFEYSDFFDRTRFNKAPNVHKSHVRN